MASSLASHVSSLYLFSSFIDADILPQSLMSLRDEFHRFFQLNPCGNNEDNKKEKYSNQNYFNSVYNSLNSAVKNQKTF